MKCLCVQLGMARKAARRKIPGRQHTRGVPIPNAFAPATVSDAQYRARSVLYIRGPLDEFHRLPRRRQPLERSRRIRESEHMLRRRFNSRTVYERLVLAHTFGDIPSRGASARYCPSSYSGSFRRSGAPVPTAGRTGPDTKIPLYELDSARRARSDCSARSDFQGLFRRTPTTPGFFCPTPCAGNCGCALPHQLALRCIPQRIVVRAAAKTFSVYSTARSSTECLPSVVRAHSGNES